MTVAKHAMQPAEVVASFLDALNRSDADAAGALTARQAPMVYPGGTVLHDVAEFLRWARTRYRRATYTYQRFDVIAQGDRAVVYAVGSIDGELNDGEAFSQVRVIDRFEVQDGIIVSKEAWSDVADLLRKKAK
jgi:limonene-1,2-epoxide hydrolase